MTEYSLVPVGEPDSMPERVKPAVMIERLETGLFELAASQSNPPVELLDWLNTRLANGNALGPDTNDPKLMQHISEGLFAHGVRQRIVAGHPVTWVRYGLELDRKVEEALSNCSERPGNVLAQLRRVLSEACSQAAAVSIRDLLTRDQMKQAGLVMLSKRHPVAGGDYEYYRLNADWFAFALSVEAFEEQCLAVQQTALSNGQIIVGQDTAQGAVMLDSETLLPKHRSKRSAVFCTLSKYLPGAWFSDVADLPKKRKQAQTWMEAVLQHYGKRSLRPSSGQLVEIAMERFGLTENAASAVWKGIDEKLKFGSGNIPDNLRVSSQQIRGLEI